VRLGNLLGRQRRYDEALARFEAVLAIEPRNAEALLGRADALAVRGRDEEALGALEQLDTIAPGQARIVLRIAAALERLKRGDEALVRYRQALALAANDVQAATAQGGIGRLLAARGENDAAIDALAQAARLDPSTVDHLLALAAFEAKLGRYVDAAAHYGEAVARDGGSEAARVGEASALLLARRWVEARARLEGGSRVLAESMTLRHLLARFLAACPDRTLRDGGRAVALAEELGGTAASDSVQETLAMALAEAGDFDRAVTIQTRLMASIDAASPGARAAARIADHLALYRRGERCCTTGDPALLLP
jgi:tetratricopeptide (TPR) repeat protein